MYINMHKFQPFGCVKVQLPSMSIDSISAELNLFKSFSGLAIYPLCVSLPFRSACIDPSLLVVITGMFIMTITKVPRKSSDLK